MITVLYGNMSAYLSIYLLSLLINSPDVASA